MSKLYLGIDVGSVSANTIIMDEHREVLEEHYTRLKGQPLQTVERILDQVLRRIEDRMEDNDVWQGKYYQNSNHNNRKT